MRPTRLSLTVANSNERRILALLVRYIARSSPDASTSLHASIHRLLDPTISGMFLSILLLVLCPQYVSIVTNMRQPVVHEMHLRHRKPSLGTVRVLNHATVLQTLLPLHFHSLLGSTVLVLRY